MAMAYLVAVAVACSWIFGLSAGGDVVQAASSSVVTVVPGRVLESRSGALFTTVDGDFEGTGRLGAGGTVQVKVAGRAGVAGDAGSVFLNVVAVSPSSSGFVTVFPCGVARPTASSVNYAAGAVVANAVLVEVGSGKVLSGLARRIDRDMGAVNIETPEDVAAFLAAQE